MKSKKIIIIIVLLIVTTLMSSIVFTASANNDINNSYGDRELESLLQYDNYSNNTLLVTLASGKEFIEKVYTVEDFESYDCLEVEDLTAITQKAINETLQCKISGKNLSARQKMISNKVATFKRILKLTLDVENKESLFKIIQELREREDIAAVSLDYYLEEFSTFPNDAYYINEQQWAIDKISLPQAWDIETGDSSVFVGIIDTGIESSHADLGNNLSTLYHRQYQQGWTNNAAPKDVSSASHGTGVAGVIGAEVNNGKGIAGVCWDVSMVSYKIGGSWSGVSSSVIAQAIDFASNDYIPILNISAGWYSNSAYYNSSLQTSINNYYGLIVCAAGNESRNIDTYTYNLYPAGYTNSNIITVGSTDEDDFISEWNPGTEEYSTSNWGPTSVDLFAPGSNINSLCWVDDNPYRSYNGTSFAAPYVAGVAALLLSKYPCMSTSEIKKAILDNVDEIDALEGKCVTGGRLNAYAALSNCNPSHDGVWEWETTSTYGHTGYCTCGELVTKAHTYRYSNITDTTHKQTCTVCDYSAVVGHIWRVTSKTVTGHIKQCACGHTVDELHTWVENAMGGYICSICRQTGNFIPGVMQSLTLEGQLLLQSANLQHGQVMLIDGLSIIYFNGEYYLLTDSTIETLTPVLPKLETE